MRADVVPDPGNSVAGCQTRFILNRMKLPHGFPVLPLHPLRRASALSFGDRDMTQLTPPPPPPKKASRGRNGGGDQIIKFRVQMDIFTCVGT